MLETGERLILEIVSYLENLFPKQRGHTTGVLTVVVERRCAIRRVARRGAWLVRCYLQYTHSPRNFRSAFRLHKLAESDGLARVLGFCGRCSEA